MRFLRGLLFCFSCLILAGFVVPFAPGPVVAGEAVRINGSGSGLAMLKPLIEAYRRANPGVSFEVQKPLGSSGAIRALTAGALDIGLSSRSLKPEETARGARLTPFGRTPLAIVTGRDVPVQDITTGDLEKIYSGVMTKWPNGEHIRIVLRPQEDIDTKILRGLSAGMDDAVTKAQARKGMIMAVTDPESDTTVSKTPGSLGAAGLTGVTTTRRPMKIISLNGVTPSTAAVASGRYPLVKEIAFVTTDRLPDAARKFLEFVYSDAGRALASKTGVLVAEGAAFGR